MMKGLKLPLYIVHCIHSTTAITLYKNKKLVKLFSVRVSKVSLIPHLLIEKEIVVHKNTGRSTFLLKMSSLI